MADEGWWPCRQCVEVQERRRKLLPLLSNRDLVARALSAIAIAVATHHPRFGPSLSSGRVRSCSTRSSRPSTRLTRSSRSSFMRWTTTAHRQAADAPMPRPYHTMVTRNVVKGSPHAQTPPTHKLPHAQVSTPRTSCPPTHLCARPDHPRRRPGEVPHAHLPRRGARLAAPGKERGLLGRRHEERVAVGRTKLPPNFRSPAPPRPSHVMS